MTLEIDNNVDLYNPIDIHIPERYEYTSVKCYCKNLLDKPRYDITGIRIAKYQINVLSYINYPAFVISLCFRDTEYSFRKRIILIGNDPYNMYFLDTLQGNGIVEPHYNIEPVKFNDDTLISHITRAMKEYINTL